MTAKHLAVLAAAILAGCEREPLAIRFKAAADEQVSIGIRSSEGTLVRQLNPRRDDTAAGKIVWDGRNSEGLLVPPGTYTWTGAGFHSLGVILNGWGCVNEVPQSTPSAPSVWVDSLWGGFGGVPVAVSADDTRVYLGWSGGRVAACDLDGHIEWSVALPGGAACRTLAIDRGSLVVLARKGTLSTARDELIKFRADTGAVEPWPGGPSLPITALWPENAESKPPTADSLAARERRIYLTFTDLQFLSVLRTDTGEYLQTVVGPPPSAIDVTPTKTDTADAPGTLIDADFAVVALQGAVLGRVLFAHEPFWAMMSDLQPLDRDERISALTLLGDRAAFHKQSVFVGLDAPFHQVQRRSVLDPEGFLWIAGVAGGRPPLGPWQPEALGRVNSVALDAIGRLWIAEGDAVPPRFSVWNTEGNQGRLEREFFGPLSPGDSGATLLPSDPAVVISGGCEWRVNPEGGLAKCLGVITRDGMQAASFRTSASGEVLLYVLHSDKTVGVFERRGEGDYVMRERGPIATPTENSPPKVTLRKTHITLDEGQGEHTQWSLTTPDGLNLEFASRYDRSSDFETGNGLDFTVAQGAGGKAYGVIAAGAFCRVEITGLDSIRRLPGGKLVVKKPEVR